TNLNVTVFGQSFSGNFAFEQVTKPGGQKIIRIGLTNVHLAMGDGANTFVELNGGTGLILLNSAGMAAGISGTVAVHLDAAVTVSGTFALFINNTSLPVNEFFTVGGQTIQLQAQPG